MIISKIIKALIGELKNLKNKKNAAMTLQFFYFIISFIIEKAIGTQIKPKTLQTKQD